MEYQKTEESTGDLIGNKIAKKITKISRRSPTHLLKKYGNLLMI